MAKQALPPALKGLAALLGEVASAAHVQNGLCSSLAAHHGCVDALTSQWVDVTGSISNNEEVVINSARHTLTAASQGRSTHALQLCIWAQGLADEGVILDGIVVQAGKVALLDISTHALLTTGDQVVAVVQLVIGVAENGGIARQRPLGVEAYTIEVGIVGTSLHERARAHSLGWGFTVAHLGSQLGGGTVCNHQHASSDLGASCRRDSPQAIGLIECCVDDLEALFQVSAIALRVLSHAVVQVDALDCTGCSLAELLLGHTDV
mmetsp:Transcript_17105/g.47441  ORF Transcript_17105/g.47441 Transcript_17105/m.47441 type:complete len:264 (-) Transcript_17105:2340-3131(-)